MGLNSVYLLSGDNTADNTVNCKMPVFIYI